MVSRVISEEIANQIAFIGESLGPLFTHDPKLEGNAIRSLFEAFVQMDTQEAAKEWPFTEDQKAAVCRYRKVWCQDLKIKRFIGNTEGFLWDHRKKLLRPGVQYIWIENK